MNEAYASQVASAQADGTGRQRMGLDGPIPSNYPPLLVVPGILELREFPTHYLTSFVRMMTRLHGYHARGFKLRDDGVLHWPARMLAALRQLDIETARMKAHHG
jgi:hypothetical protein